MSGGEDRIAPVKATPRDSVVIAAALPALVGVVTVISVDLCGDSDASLVGSNFMGGVLAASSAKSYGSSVTPLPEFPTAADEMAVEEIPPERVTPTDVIDRPSAGDEGVTGRRDSSLAEVRCELSSEEEVVVVSDREILVEPVMGMLDNLLLLSPDRVPVVVLLLLAEATAWLVGVGVPVRRLLVSGVACLRLTAPV